MQPPYYPPPAPGVGPSAPSGVTWFRVYCVVQALFALGTLGFGLFFAIAPIVDPKSFPINPGDPPMIPIGVVMALVGLVSLVAYIIGMWAPRRPWMYSYGIAVTAISLLCGCWMLGIVVLVMWLKPETRQWFGVA